MEKDAILSPFAHQAQQLHPQHHSQKTAIRNFLRCHFGTPPTTPVLDIPEDALLGPLDTLFYVANTEGHILGCVRYHHIGHLVSNPLYLVDCFCIHPQFRKQGLADYLLTTLHRFANQHGIPYALFLKEGPPLPIWSIPLFTGHYVYRRVQRRDHVPSVQHLTPEEAHRLVRVFHEINPDALVIQPSSTSNQTWRLYRISLHQCILACVQDTYQWWKEADGQQKKMGWITAWLESPMVTVDKRTEAIKAITDSTEGQFDYVWANRNWIGTATDTEWQEDGAFHWYAYQWTTALNIKRGYCIVH